MAPYFFYWNDTATSTAGLGQNGWHGSWAYYWSAPSEPVPAQSLDGRVRARAALAATRTAWEPDAAPLATATPWTRPGLVRRTPAARSPSGCLRWGGRRPIPR